MKVNPVRGLAPRWRQACRRHRAFVSAAARWAPRYRVAQGTTEKKVKVCYQVTYHRFRGLWPGENKTKAKSKKQKAKKQKSKKAKSKSKSKKKKRKAVPSRPRR
jgi:hypothetical protein